MPGFKPSSATAQSNQGGEQKEAPSESLAAPTSLQNQTPSRLRELLKARGAAERDRGDPRAIRVPTPGIGRAAAPAVGPALPDAHRSHSREAAAAVAAPGHPGLCHPPREIYGALCEPARCRACTAPGRLRPSLPRKPGGCPAAGSRHCRRVPSPCQPLPFGIALIPAFTHIGQARITAATPSSPN